MATEGIARPTGDIDIPVIPQAGWVCPVCRRGVAPNEKTCDHAGAAQPALPALPQPVFIPSVWPPNHPDPFKDDGMCAACRNGRVCMCVRPSRHTLTVGDAVANSFGS